MPLLKQLNVADGRLASASATLFVSADGQPRTITVTLYNTSGSVTETINLTVTRPGSTARQIARAELGPRESAYIENVALDPADVLAGYATDADMVDYLIGVSSGAFSYTVRDKTGAPKATQSLTVTIPEKQGLTEGEVTIAGLLEDMRDALLQIK